MNKHLEMLLQQLRLKGITYRLIELKDRAISVDDVIKFSKGDITKEEICKTMIVKAGETYCAVFLKGDKRLDFGKLQRILGEKTRLATPEEVKDITGVDPGAVCPLLLNIPVIIDRKVLELKNINFGSGDHLYGIEMKPSDILKIKDAKIAEASQ